MDFVGRKPGGGVDGIVVGRRNVWQQHVPIGSLFVSDHGEHLGQDMVDALDAAVGAGVVSAGVDLVDPKAVVIGVSKLGIEVESVVREERHWAAPKGDVFVDEDVGGAGGRELSC